MVWHIPESLVFHELPAGFCPWLRGPMLEDPFSVGITSHRKSALMDATHFNLSHMGLSGSSKSYSFIYPLLCFLGNLGPLFSGYTRPQQERQLVESGHKVLFHWRYCICCLPHQCEEQQGHPFGVPFLCTVMNYTGQKHRAL